ncbi:MAG: Bacterial regulatory protein luxR family [Candidatus Eremiobacteraeota bacterium]|jgi:DNA-binding CsgD family transcriptional regulator|nr:Bacterial regulatory protein luxR family [Candidatus Eremiobacteraeota bacterium]
MHAALYKPVVDTVAGEFTDNLDEELLDVVRARKPLDFYIVDAELNVHLRRGDNMGPRADRLPDHIYRAARALLDAEFTDTAVVPVRRDLALRVLRVYSGSGVRYALFLEPYLARDFVLAAVKRYVLTLREGTVLDLILRGTSTGDIAERLGITEGTVHQHVKNLGGKIGVTKRNAIVATVLGLVAA